MKGTAAVVFVSILLAVVGAVAVSSAYAGSNSTPPVPPGMPSYSDLNSTGYSLADLVEQTAPFKALADGTTYSIRPYQSFGYEWGATIPSAEIITFFSPSGLLTIEAIVITAPAPGTTSVNQSQIALVCPSGVNSTSTLFLDLPLDLNGTSNPNSAPSFNPIIVSMVLGNSTGYLFYR